MVFVTGKVISFDSKKATLMPVSNFLQKYKQNQSLMKKMLQKTQKI